MSGFFDLCHRRDCCLLIFCWSVEIIWNRIGAKICYRVWNKSEGVFEFGDLRLYQYPYIVLHRVAHTLTTSVHPDVIQSIWYPQNGNVTPISDWLSWNHLSGCRSQPRQMIFNSSISRVLCHIHLRILTRCQRSICYSSQK